MSPDCQSTRDLISDSIAGTLPEAAEQTLRTHLDACPECRRYAQALEQEDALLADHFTQIEAGRAARQARVLDTLRNHYAEPGTDPLSIRSRILKRRISQLALAAAAVFAIVMGLHLCGDTFRTTNTVYALDQTVAAMSAVRFVHVVRRDEVGGPLQEERWIEIGPDGRQVRYRHDKPPHHFVINDGEVTARYDRFAKTVILYDTNEMPYRWIDPLGQTFENLSQEGMIVEEDARFRGRRVHRVWWPMMREVCCVDPVTRRAIAIGDLELSYEEPPAGTFAITQPEDYDRVNDPAEAGGQEDVLYADVELINPERAMMEIINRHDIMRLYSMGPHRYEGDLDLRVRCDSDVAWGLSIAGMETAEGTGSCWVDKFELAAPGGVATVGVKFTGDAPRASKVATVRLSPTPLPDPAHDARAWQTLGLALYDARRYEEALDAFEKMEAGTNADREDQALAVTWQGHMLDLLGRREEAIARYREVIGMGLDSSVQHGRYGLTYDFTSYPQQRIEAPFTRVENRDAY